RWQDVPLADDRPDHQRINHEVDPIHHPAAEAGPECPPFGGREDAVELGQAMALIARMDAFKCFTHGPSLAVRFFCRSCSQTSPPKYFSPYFARLASPEFLMSPAAGSSLLSSCRLIFSVSVFGKASVT